MKTVILKPYPPLYKGDRANDGLYKAVTKSGFEVGTVDMRNGCGNATFSLTAAWRDVSSAEQGRAWLDETWRETVEGWHAELPSQNTKMSHDGA